MASQITSLTIVYSTVYSGADQRKHQSSASMAIVREIHRWPVNSPHKGPVTRKMFPFDDVIMHFSLLLDWLDATRAMIVLGLICLILAMFICILSLCTSESSRLFYIIQIGLLFASGKYVHVVCCVPSPLQWRRNMHDEVSNHQPYDCLLNRLFRRRSKKTSKLRVNGLCEGNSPVTGEFPAQRASNAENVSIWWRHHANQVIKARLGQYPSNNT